MPAWLRSLGQACRYCADVVVSLACWTLWLALGILLALQIAVAVSHEFAVPKFVLRSIEQKFSASHVTPRFGRATFDPTGRILIENLRLSLPEFVEPVIDVRAVFVELDPWALLAGEMSASRIYATGVKFFVPAMLAPSGRSEEILSDLEVVLVPHHDQYSIETLTARVAGIAVTAHGSIQVKRMVATGRVESLPLLENLARHYADFSRQLIRASEKLAMFEGPAITLQLTPSAAHGAIGRTRITAKGIRYPGFHGLRATGVELTAQFPLWGEAMPAAPATLALREIKVGEALARNVTASVTGTLNPRQFAYAPGDVEITAAEVMARGFILKNAVAVVTPGALPQLTANVEAAYEDVPMIVNAQVNLAEKTAALHVDGALSPGLLVPISAQMRRDVRRFIGFGEPVKIVADVTFEPGWKFAQLGGYIWARDVDAYGVPIDAAQGHIDFDGRHFVARRARAKLGANFARGSFEQDLQTKEFRFLLEGRLRPLAIKGWFREWWPEFFEHFEFPVAPPAASVDVAGRWFSGWETTVFVFAETEGASIRGAKFDYARTLMFIRPNFFDGLELWGTRGEGRLQGTFTRTVDFNANAWANMDLALESTLDLDAGVKLLGPALGERLQPYTFEKSPTVKVTGHFDGPASPNGEHQKMRIDAQSSGSFTAFQFPGHDLSFVATVSDDDVVLEPLKFQVAEGTVAGKAHLWGPETQKRLGVDAAVHGAKFGQAITTVANFAAARRGQPPPPAEKFLSSTNNAILDLSLVAEGQFDNLQSYHGTGHAKLAGPALGEIRLLGLLSQLLNFTALRFTSATADFSVDGPKLTFPTVSVTGANSAIQAHGEYAMDRRQLDFNARVYPFQESKSFLQTVVGTVLSPLSVVLEVKLTGSLDQANWAFVIGPTNFFRALSQPDTTTPAAPPPEPDPSPPLKR